MKSLSYRGGETSRCTHLEKPLTHFDPCWLTVLPGKTHTHTHILYIINCINTHWRYKFPASLQMKRNKGNRDISIFTFFIIMMWSSWLEDYFKNIKHFISCFQNMTLITTKQWMMIYLCKIWEWFDHVHFLLAACNCTSQANTIKQTHIVPWHTLCKSSAFSWSCRLSHAFYYAIYLCHWRCKDWSWCVPSFFWANKL